MKLKEEINRLCVELKRAGCRVTVFSASDVFFAVDGGGLLPRWFEANLSKCYKSKQKYLLNTHTHV